jgi:hypothetical protein
MPGLIGGGFGVFGGSSSGGGSSGGGTPDPAVEGVQSLSATIGLNPTSIDDVGGDTLYVGTNVVKVSEVRLNPAGTLLSAAAVSVTITDPETRAQVVGAVDLPLAPTGIAGAYIAAIPANLILVRDHTYELAATIVVTDGPRVVLEQLVQVR